MRAPNPPPLRHFGGAEPTADAIRRAAGALALVADRGRAGPESFLGRRAARAVERLPAGPDRRHLRRVLSAPSPERTADALIAWASELEAASRVAEATRAMDDELEAVSRA